MFKQFNIKQHNQLFLFLILLMIKFMIARALLFEDGNILYTIVVEFGYLLFLLALIELIPQKKMKTTIYVIFNLALSILLLAILLYYDYYGHILTVHAFSLIGQVGAVSDSVLELVRPVYLVLFLDFLLLPIYYVVRRKQKKVKAATNFKFIIPAIAIGALIIGINIFVQKDNQIASTIVAAEKQGILTYELLTAQSLMNNDVTDLSETETEELKERIYELKNITPLSDEEKDLHGIAQDKNIIVIQGESIQDFVIDLEIDGQEITPFLNQMVENGLYFPNVYQQISAGNTSDAEFMFNTSLYPPAWTAASETFGDRALPSLPKMLKEDGYTSLTFHANEVTFWNRNQMYPALGFDRYYDDSFFGNEDVIGIGPSDEVVYEKSFPELKELYDDGKKFYAHFISLSSHHPFKIPADKIPDFELPERFNDTMLKDYLESAYYTDLTVQQLVEDLKSAGMWEDTILVFYGDHHGMVAKTITDKERELLAPIVGHKYTFVDQFNIPFIIQVPGVTDGQVFENVGGQLDMMPTVANLLGLSLEDHIHFGQDLVNYTSNLFGVRYYKAYGTFFNDEIVFEPNEGFEDGEAFYLETGEPVEDFSKYRADYDRILEILKTNDDYMEQLPLKKTG